jgi:hypothetical protein
MAFMLIFFDNVECLRSARVNSGVRFLLNFWIEGTSEPSQVLRVKVILEGCSDLNALSLAHESRVDEKVN